MPNSRSAAKRVRQTAVRSMRNRMYKSRIKTAVRRFEEALASGDVDTARELLQRASSVIDKAAGKGVMHRNAAARRKSRLARGLRDAVSA